MKLNNGDSLNGLCYHWEMFRLFPWAATGACALLISCSDPADKLDPAVEKARADSLRVEIRTTQERIESLQDDRARRLKTLDSLNIPHDSL